MYGIATSSFATTEATEITMLALTLGTGNITGVSVSSSHTNNRSVTYPYVNFSFTLVQAILLGGKIVIYMDYSWGYTDTYINILTTTGYQLPFQDKVFFYNKSQPVHPLRSVTSLHSVRRSNYFQSRRL